MFASFFCLFLFLNIYRFDLSKSLFTYYEKSFFKVYACLCLCLLRFLKRFDLSKGLFTYYEKSFETSSCF